MNTFVVIFAVLAAANAGLIAAPSARIIQGPSTRTTVVGPDGSAIDAVAPGGTIIAENNLGLVAHAAPVFGAGLVARSAYAAPFLAAPSLAYSGVAAHDTVIAGPSGTIATTRGLHAPAFAYNGLYY